MLKVLNDLMVQEFLLKPFIGSKNTPLMNDRLKMSFFSSSFQEKLTFRGGFSPSGGGGWLPW